MYEATQNAIYRGPFDQPQGIMNTPSPPKPSVMDSLAQKLEEISQSLNETMRRQKALLVRLHGDRPEKDSNPTGQLKSSGAVGDIEARLNHISYMANELAEINSILERIA